MDNANNPNASQANTSPAEQPAATPTSQPAEQPTVPPMNQPAGAPTNGSSKKKNGIIISCIIGGLVLCGIIVALILIFTNGGGKTVSCTQEQTTMGIEMKATTDVKVADGSIKEVKMDTVIDLASMSDYYKKNESKFVEGILEGLESQCDGGKNCEFSHTYKEGEKVTVTMKATGGSLVGSFGDIEGMSAQEIADQVQKTLERTGAVCKQR